jgi:hypothetical protein
LQAPSTPPLPTGARFAYGTSFVQPPDGCQTATRGPITFQQCGTDWLQPVMQAGNVYYIAVPPPT